MPSTTDFATSSVLNLNSSSTYTVGSKNQATEVYGTLKVGANTDIRMWNSSATTSYDVDSSGSLYSQDHAASDGSLHVWGDYHTTSTDYCSYATDFDGTAVTRQCQATINSGTSITVDNGAILEIKGGGSSSGDISVVSASVLWDLNNNGTTTIQEATINYLNPASGTITVLNTTLNNEDTPDAATTLNVDWYLGIHVIDKNDTSQNIGNATCTIEEKSTTSKSTIWKHNGSSWGTASTSQTTVTQASGSATGTIPQPNSSGAIRIREYSATSSGTAYYKYNLTIDSLAGFSTYNYYSDYGSKYLTSTSSPETDEDTVIWEGWQRDDIGSMNSPYSCSAGTGDACVNEPPDDGSWYAGMSSDLEFSVDSTTAYFPNLNLLNDLTATATTILYVTSTVGYIIQAFDVAGNEGELTTTTFSIPRWSSDNATPTEWGTNCITNPSYCGFGYTTDDNDLTGGTVDRFATSTNFAGFTSSTEPVADRGAGTWQNEQNIITYKVSVSRTQTAAADYNTTIEYICTAQY